MLLTLCLTASAAWDDTEVRRIEERIQLPQIPDREFVITKFGAKPSASAKDNQAAINRAIATASRKGGGRVVVPAGEWLTGAIRLESHVELAVAEGATLRFAFDTSLYPLVKTAWEGLACWNYSPCIYACGATDIAITGKGTIDGGGNKTTWWPMCGSARYGYEQGTTLEAQNLGARARLQQQAEDGVPADERRYGQGQGLRPQLVNFVECERILMQGVTLLNSPFWVIHPLRSRSITVDGVTVVNRGPNGDGCDPEACEDVMIKNCVFDTGDDCIAIKSGRNNDGRLWQQPSRNIIIRHCTMKDGHGGVVIGSEISGGCENVYAEDCDMDSPNLERVLRIKTNNCRGGLVENINMRDIRVGQCKEAVLKINLDYERREQCYRGFSPTVRRVSMERVTCKKSNYGVLIIGLEDTLGVYDIDVRDCRFDGVAKQPVSITGKTAGIRFDSLFINGSLTLTAAERPYKNYSEWMTYSEMKRTPQSWLLDFSKKPKWSYVMGIELEAMLDTYLQHGGDSIQRYVSAYLEKMVDDKGNVTGYKYEDFNLDNIRTAKFIVNPHLTSSREKKNGKIFFKQLQHQPRTQDGIFWHKAIYANQVWLDGIFMGLPFYCLYASQTLSAKKARKVYDDAVDQILKTDLRTYDPATQLWKHAWDETHGAFWADSVSGQSRHTWARALGWYAMAITEVLDIVPADYERRTELTRLLQKVMASVVRCQDKASGVWYDVLDVKDDRNYLESTASCMFAYVLLKATRKGWLPEKLMSRGKTTDFRAAGLKAYDGILRRFVRVNADKTLTLTDCCAVSGLGPAPGPNVKKPNYRRDGSFEYYMSEPIRDNDAKGIGPFIWASLEMER